MKDYSGPAFPTFFTDSEGGATMMGMTLRDYFAAKALQGMTANPTTEGDVDTLATTLAKYSYQLADAMLLAREN